MATRGEKIDWRFWLPVLLLGAFAAYSTQKLIRAHIDPEVSAPKYVFEKQLQARRGSIYSSYGKSYPFVRSVPFWEYSLDPVSLTNCIVKSKGKPRRTKEEIVKTIADTLNLSYDKVLAMANAPKKVGYRSQFLALSSDTEAYKVLADSSQVAGVAIHDKQVRQYLHGRHLSHVLGSVNANYDGSAGIELRYNRVLTGLPGTIRGLRDARGRELYDKREVSIAPTPGSDIYLTIDHNIQFEVEDALKWGIEEFGAGSGWSIVMDSHTGAILAMASMPDFDPLRFGNTKESAKVNRAVAFNYEPGSVMKVISLASAIDAGFVKPSTIYNTARNDPKYYKLPGDGSHVWEPYMSLKDAIVHSSNIVIGKLGYDFGPQRLFKYMQAFGFGSKTGIELPGEQYGILPNPNKRMWDKASWSRAAIGQFVAVTGIQLISAYQAIANDGLRMKPYIVDRIEDAKGNEVFKNVPTALGCPISSSTAKTMRDVMLGVASAQGTARRAAICGYSVAGKTGTAQKQIPGGRGYYQGLYRASFCGIVPASNPRLVILVTLDFDEKTKYHQGGNSSGRVFKRIGIPVLRYLRVPPDRPEEIDENADTDELDLIMSERPRKYAMPLAEDGAVNQ